MEVDEMSRGMIVLVVLGGLLGIGVVLQLPEIRRYMKMRSM
jgi:hypothetical protein